MAHASCDSIFPSSLGVMQPDQFPSSVEFRVSRDPFVEEKEL